MSAAEQPPESEHRPHHTRWTLHSLGAPGVRLSQAEMIALAAAILGRAR